MREKISVVVPAYNCADYIRKCIDSLLAQRGAEIEVIVVNDGSGDNTVGVLEEYKNSIRLISVENGGVARARNVGLRYVTGDFVMFVDADDALEQDCIEKVMEKQRASGADIVRFGYCLVYKDGSRALPVNRFENEELIEKDCFKEKIYKKYIDGIMLNSICMTLFRKETLEGLTFRRDMETAEDAVFSMQAYSRAKRVLLLPDAFYLYYQSGGGLTGSGISVFTKYRCNAILSGEIVKRLPSWGMNTPSWFLKAVLRPVFLTFDKLRRIKKETR